MKQFNFFRSTTRLLMLWMSFIFIVAMEIQGWAATKTNIGINWTDPTHWSPAGVPTSIDNIIINNTILTSNNDTRNCLSLTLNPGSTLTINDNCTVSVGSGGVTIVGSGLISHGDKSFLKYSPNSTLTYSGTTLKTVGKEWPTTNGPAIVTINNSKGIKLSTSRVLAHGKILNHIQGLFDTGNDLTMATTSTINRSGGSFIGTLQGTGVYNVYYTGDSITTGSELSGSGLNDITIDMTDGQTLTLNQLRSPDGDLTVSSGIFDLSSFTINRSSSGGTLSIANGATLKIGKTNTFPSNYSTHTLEPTSTVEYSGAIQSVSNETYGNLTLSGTGVKSMSAGSAVTVSGNLITNNLLAINSDDTHSGSLIVHGTSSGQVTYKRWLHSAAAPATYSRWYITSAPVNVTSGFNANAGKIHQDANAGNVYDFAPYIESYNDWNYLAAIPSPLDAGKGYLISLKPALDGIIQFTGTLNDGNVTPTVTSSLNNGWNAVGNPYTSAIWVKNSTLPAEDFLTKNASQFSDNYAAIYVWNETGAYTTNDTYEYYKVIGNSGYTPPGLPGGTISEDYIQAGQGFLINAKANSTVTFTKAMQDHQPTVTLKSGKVSWPGLTLLAQSQGQTRSTVVAYNEQMTTGLDVTYDAGLLPTDVFQVYTHLVEGTNPVDFAIQCLPDNQYRELSVPVGIDLPEGGELSFKASGVILPAGLYPAIEDKVLGIRAALKTETDSYTVTLDKNTLGTGRFYLSVEGIALWKPEVPLQTNYTASLVKGRIVLNGAVTPGTKAMLFDISGRKVGEYPLANTNRNEITVLGKVQGIYLLKVESRHFSQTLKLVALNN